MCVVLGMELEPHVNQLSILPVSYISSPAKSSIHSLYFYSGEFGWVWAHAHKDSLTCLSSGRMWHTHSPFVSYSSLPFSLRQGLSLAWTVSPKGSPVPFSPSQGSELILPNPAFLKWILGMELHSWDLQGKRVTNYFPRSCIQHIVSLPKIICWPFYRKV